MKLRDIFALLTLTVMVKGAWLAAAVQPVIVSLGAVLTAVDLDIFDMQPIQWKSWLPFINKQASDEKQEKNVGNDKEKENTLTPEEKADLFNIHHDILNQRKKLDDGLRVEYKPN